MDEKKKLGEAVLIMIGVMLLISFMLGYIIGHYTEEKDMLNFLAWWKVNNDCKTCQNYNCNMDYWALFNGSHGA